MLPRLESGGARQLRDGVQGGRLSRAYVPGPLTSTSHGDGEILEDGPVRARLPPGVGWGA